MKVYEGVLKNYTQIMSNQNYAKTRKSEYDELLKLKKEISKAKKEAEDVIKKQKEYMMSVDKLIQRRSKEIALELFEETFGDVPETYESRLKTFCENHICDNDGKSVYEHFTAYNKEMYERIIRDDEVQDFLEDQREFLKKATGEKDAWIV
jgi:sugar-specific transcriptional regulator TrmB